MSFMQNSPPSWISAVARAGYSAKGVVYGVIGVLAALAAFGSGGETTDSKGAIRAIGQQPFGQVLLGLLALGLLCYALWRFLSAFVDAEGKGSDAKGIVQRTGYFVSGMIHLGLTFATAMILIGGRSSGGDSGAKDWTAKLMSAPFGPWLVIGVGVIVAGVGLAQWTKVWKGSYREKFDLDGAAASQREWIERVAKAGLIARGVVFLIIGFFLALAGWQTDASEARGLEGALDALARQPYGPWLLGATGVGLLCYGIYCCVIARYGRFPKNPGR